MKKYLLFISIAFAACGKEPQKKLNSSNPEITLGLLFEHDGCKVYRFYDHGNAVYFSDCSGKINYNKTTSNGKTTQVKRIQTLNQ